MICNKTVDVPYFGCCPDAPVLEVAVSLIADYSYGVFQHDGTDYRTQTVTEKWTNCSRFGVSIPDATRTYVSIFRNRSYLSDGTQSDDIQPEYSDFYQDERYGKWDGVTSPYVIEIYEPIGHHQTITITTSFSDPYSESDALADWMVLWSQKDITTEPFNLVTLPNVSYCDNIAYIYGYNPQNGELYNPASWYGWVLPDAYSPMYLWPVTPPWLPRDGFLIHRYFGVGTKQVWISGIKTRRIVANDVCIAHVDYGVEPIGYNPEWINSQPTPEYSTHLVTIHNNAHPRCPEIGQKISQGDGTFKYKWQEIYTEPDVSSINGFKWILNCSSIP